MKEEGKKNSKELKLREVHFYAPRLNILGGGIENYTLDDRRARPLIAR